MCVLGEGRHLSRQGGDGHDRAGLTGDPFARLQNRFVPRVVVPIICPPDNPDRHSNLSHTVCYDQLPRKVVLRFLPMRVRQSSLRRCPLENTRRVKTPFPRCFTFLSPSLSRTSDVFFPTLMVLLLFRRCPFPPVLGPLVLGRLEPPKDLAVFPVRASGGNIQVSMQSVSLNTCTYIHDSRQLLHLMMTCPTTVVVLVSTLGLQEGSPRGNRENSPRPESFPVQAACSKK